MHNHFDSWHSTEQSCKMEPVIKKHNSTIGGDRIRAGEFTDTHAAAVPISGPAAARPHPTARSSQNSFRMPGSESSRNHLYVSARESLTHSSDVTDWGPDGSPSPCGSPVLTEGATNGPLSPAPAHVPRPPVGPSHTATPPAFPALPAFVSTPPTSHHPLSGHFAAVQPQFGGVCYSPRGLTSIHATALDGNAPSVGGAGSPMVLSSPAPPMASAPIAYVSCDAAAAWGTPPHVSPRYLNPRSPHPPAYAPGCVIVSPPACPDADGITTPPHLYEALTAVHSDLPPPAPADSACWADAMTPSFAFSSPAAPQQDGIRTPHASARRGAGPASARGAHRDAHSSAYGSPFANSPIGAVALSPARPAGPARASTAARGPGGQQAGGVGVPPGTPAGPSLPDVVRSGGHRGVPATSAPCGGSAGGESGHPACGGAMSSFHSVSQMSVSSVTTGPFGMPRESLAPTSVTYGLASSQASVESQVVVVGAQVPPAPPAPGPRPGGGAAAVEAGPVPQGYGPRSPPAAAAAAHLRTPSAGTRRAAGPAPPTPATGARAVVSPAHSASHTPVLVSVRAADRSRSQVCGPQRSSSSAIQPRSLLSMFAEDTAAEPPACSTTPSSATPRSHTTSMSVSVNVSESSPSHTPALSPNDPSVRRMAAPHPQSPAVGPAPVPDGPATRTGPLVGGDAACDARDASRGGASEIGGRMLSSAAQSAMTAVTASSSLQGGTRSGATHGASTTRSSTIVLPTHDAILSSELSIGCVLAEASLRNASRDAATAGPASGAQSVRGRPAGPYPGVPPPAEDRTMRSPRAAAGPAVLVPRARSAAAGPLPAPVSRTSVTSPTDPRPPASASASAARAGALPPHPRGPTAGPSPARGHRLCPNGPAGDDGAAAAPRAARGGVVAAVPVGLGAAQTSPAPGPQAALRCATAGPAAPAAVTEARSTARSFAQPGPPAPPPTAPYSPRVSREEFDAAGDASCWDTPAAHRSRSSSAAGWPSMGRRGVRAGASASPQQASHVGEAWGGANAAPRGAPAAPAAGRQPAAAAPPPPSGPDGRRRHVWARDAPGAQRSVESRAVAAAAVGLAAALSIGAVDLDDVDSAASPSPPAARGMAGCADQSTQNGAVSAVAVAAVAAAAAVMLAERTAPSTGSPPHLPPCPAWPHSVLDLPLQLPCEREEPRAAADAYVMSAGRGGRRSPHALSELPHGAFSMLMHASMLTSPLPTATSPTTAATARPMTALPGGSYLAQWGGLDMAGTDGDVMSPRTRRMLTRSASHSPHHGVPHQSTSPVGDAAAARHGVGRVARPMDAHHVVGVRAPADHASPLGFVADPRPSPPRPAVPMHPLCNLWDSSTPTRARSSTGSAAAAASTSASMHISEASPGPWPPQMDGGNVGWAGGAAQFTGARAAAMPVAPVAAQPGWHATAKRLPSQPAGSPHHRGAVVDPRPTGRPAGSPSAAPAAPIAAAPPLHSPVHSPRSALHHAAYYPPAQRALLANNAAAGIVRRGRPSASPSPRLALAPAADVATPAMRYVPIVPDPLGSHAAPWLRKDRTAQWHGGEAAAPPGHSQWDRDAQAMPPTYVSAANGAIYGPAGVGHDAENAHVPMPAGSSTPVDGGRPGAWRTKGGLPTSHLETLPPAPLQERQDRVAAARMGPEASDESIGSLADVCRGITGSLDGLMMSVRSLGGLEGGVM